MSGDAASEPAVDDALATLERVVLALGDELAFFRRRALDAERRVRDLLAAQQRAGTASHPPGEIAAPDPARMAALEAENADLHARIAEAAERARTVASRLRFARQQDAAAQDATS